MTEREDNGPDALFGPDGTAGGGAGTFGDGIGQLPGLDLPVVPMPVIGPDGQVHGMGEIGGDVEAEDGGTAAAPSSEHGGSRIGARLSGTPPGLAPPGLPPSGPLPSGPLPSGASGGFGGFGAAVPGPPVVSTSRSAARPRIETEPAILGLSRHSRSRLGSRAFTLLFVVVFTLIVVQLVVTLLEG